MFSDMPELPIEPEARLRMLLSLLLDESGSFRHHAIGRLGGSEIELLPLIELMQTSTDPVVLTGVPCALARFKDSRAFDALCQTLSHPTAEVRESGCMNLGFLGDPRAVPYLIGMLQDPSSDVRFRAVNALSGLQDAGVIEPLISALADSSRGVRSAAADQLGYIRDERVIMPLLQLLHDPAPRVKESAIVSLGMWRDARAFEPLKAFLHDPDEDVRCAAIETVSFFRDVSVLPALRQLIVGAGVQRQIALGKSLKRLNDPQGQEMLVNLLQDTDPEVRLASVESLEEVGDLTVVPRLQEVALNDSAIAGNNYVIAHIAKDAIQAIERRAHQSVA